MVGGLEGARNCCWVWDDRWRDKAAFHPSQSRNPQGVWYLSPPVISPSTVSETKLIYCGCGVLCDVQE